MAILILKIRRKGNLAT